MFSAVGRFDIRFRWLIVAVWIIGVIAGVRLLPSLSSVTKTSNAQFLPSSSPSVQAAGLAAPFQGGNPSGTAIITASRASSPLTATDGAAIARVEHAARQVPGVSLVKDEGTSKDGMAAEALVTVGPSVAGSSTAARNVVDGIRAVFGRVRAPAGLSFHLTGQLAVSVDASNTHVAGIERFTVLFVIVLLFAVYRAILAPLITLIPAALSVVLSGPLIAGAAGAGVPVSPATQQLLIVLLLGAGTDYGLFLVFRMREEMLTGTAPRLALVTALGRAGQAITYSGLTVAVALLTLLIAPFGVYRGLGPALAIGIGVMLAAGLTLTPALLAIFGRATFWPAHPRPGPRRDMWAQAQGIAGQDASAYDILSASTTSLAEVVPVVLVLILVLLGLLLRSLVAPWYLTLTVGLSYLASLGFAMLVFVHLGGARRAGVRAAAADVRVLHGAIGITGGTVTSAGTILAGTFTVLGLAGGNGQAQQLGFSVAFGVVLDTFFVRTLLVPSIAMLLGRWNWWPATPAPARTVRHYLSPQKPNRREHTKVITIHGRTAPARPRPAGLAVPLAAAALAALLAAAGCSSPASTTSSPATTAAGSGGAQSTGSARLAQFAQCMRSHGVPDFPDPTAQGTFNLLPAMTGSAQFQSADQACRSLAPPGSLSGQGPTTQQLNEAVKFVGCMRKHGVPNFPDPGPSGKFQLQGGPNPVNPHAPQFKSALQACRTLMPPGNGFGAGS